MLWLSDKSRQTVKCLCNVYSSSGLLDVFIYSCVCVCVCVYVLCISVCVCVVYKCVCMCCV